MVATLGRVKVGHGVHAFAGGDIAGGLGILGEEAAWEIVGTAAAIGVGVFVVKLIKARRASELAGEIVEEVTEVASSRVLGRALESAGQVRPAGAAAHHIVAGNAGAAAPARAVLRRYKISINDANNGVFLPANKSSPNANGAAVHSSVHTEKYYTTVNQMLGAATSEADVLAALAEIRQALLSGGL